MLVWHVNYIVLCRFHGFQCMQIFLETREKKDWIGKALASCGCSLRKRFVTTYKHWSTLLSSYGDSDACTTNKPHWFLCIRQAHLHFVRNFMKHQILGKWPFNKGIEISQVSLKISSFVLRTWIKDFDFKTTREWIKDDNFHLNETFMLTFVILVTL